MDPLNCYFVVAIDLSPEGWEAVKLKKQSRGKKIETKRKPWGVEESRRWRARALPAPERYSKEVASIFVSRRNQSSKSKVDVFRASLFWIYIPFLFGITLMDSSDMLLYLAKLSNPSLSYNYFVLYVMIY